jgi:hypothetical protein
MYMFAMMRLGSKNSNRSLVRMLHKRGWELVTAPPLNPNAFSNNPMGTAAAALKDLPESFCVALQRAVVTPVEKLRAL